MRSFTTKSYVNENGLVVRYHAPNV